MQNPLRVAIQHVGQREPLLLAHHPTCEFYDHHVLEVYGQKLCMGCFVVYPVGFVSLVTLLLGSRALVDGAASLAGIFGISDLVIGLTIVALGTSLPELAAALAAVAKREDDLVVGNVVGSCLLNLLLVLGVPALTGGLPASPDALWRDWPILLGLTLILGPVFFAGPRTPRGLARVGRVEAGVLLAVYVGYIGYLFTTGEMPRS